jgi:hypothetical protein
MSSARPGATGSRIDSTQNNVGSSRWSGDRDVRELVGRVRVRGQGSRHRCRCSKAATGGPLTMNDGIGLAERLLGLDGFRVLEVSEEADELVITIETTADFVGCSDCGVRAESHDRRPISIRDLSCFGRPARLVWIKRRWRCREAACDAKRSRSARACARSRRCGPGPGPDCAAATRCAAPGRPWCARGFAAGDWSGPRARRGPRPGSGLGAGGAPARRTGHWFADTGPPTDGTAPVDTSD